MSGPDSLRRSTEGHALLLNFGANPEISCSPPIRPYVGRSCHVDECTDDYGAHRAAGETHRVDTELARETRPPQVESGGTYQALCEYVNEQSTGVVTLQCTQGALSLVSQTCQACGGACSESCAPPDLSGLAKDPNH